MFKVIRDVNPDIDGPCYDACIEAIRTTLVQQSWCLGIAQFGTIKFPGISDIDLLIVIDRNVSYDETKMFVERTIADAPYSDYCFSHGTIIVTDLEFEFVKLFHTIDQLRFLYTREGEPLTPNDYSRLDQPLTLIWNSYFYELFLRILHAPKMKQRLALLAINNLSFSLRKYDAFLGTSFSEAYQEDVNAIRERSLLDREFEPQTIRQMLSTGLEQLSRQESRLFQGTPRTFMVHRAGRTFYFPSEHLFFRSLRIVRAVGFPPVYFHFLRAMKSGRACAFPLFNEYLKEIRNCTRELRMPYALLQQRFVGVSLMGYQDI